MTTQLLSIDFPLLNPKTPFNPRNIQTNPKSFLSIFEFSTVRILYLFFSLLYFSITHKYEACEKFHMMP